MKVIVGMSGGVDSSVAAILLQQAGYEVEGLFMRNWDSSLNNDFNGNPDLQGHSICPQEEDYNDALEVCNKLGIKLHRIDFIQEYWDYVFKYFLDELSNGRTPNPDVFCNKYIKFDLFKKEAFRLGADLIATGHYAKLEDGYLKKADDLNKDQSYFLCQLSKEQLDKVLFPLATVSKPEVRKIAEEYGLITAKKKDSTGICFIGERHFQEFLTNYFPQKKGAVVNIDTGKVIGEHRGLMYYTIGQRRGLNIGGFCERMYVVKKDLKHNILYITLNENSKYLKSNKCIVDKLNFNCDLRPINCFCKFRYRGEDIPVQLKYHNDSIELTYDYIKSVTPGQIAVLYDGNICIGGGIIEAVYRDNELIS